jgi:acyl transferase domain-containing protein/acyl carrier protein
LEAVDLSGQDRPPERPYSSRRVLLALKEARARLEAAERVMREPIAIVGIGCRFPGGADGPETFWRVLRDGVDTVCEIPPDRYDVNAYYDPSPGIPGRTYVREGAYLEGIDRFDAPFFNISPREAVSLDPQQRLLLEVAWEALEDAGQAPDRLRGSRTGVFVGIGRNDYGHLLLQGGPNSVTAWHATGNGLCYGPGRLAHALGLRGPNMAIDTACSSSLLAVHLACQSLRMGECDLALAGGCHLNISPHSAVMLASSTALAADGRCKTFDVSADGFGLGEGCGVVVLRRASDAAGRGDRVLALIRGSAVNHDGHGSGLTVPSETAQADLLREALANARVAPREVSYVEAHGTGTALGDPIEVGALAAVFAADRLPNHPLVIGSVKTNLGHLEAASGVAGLIKVVLSLDREEIPPHLHFRAPNPGIPWDKLPLVVPTRRTPWPRVDSPRVAGVSSFGMSGANAHVVLEEAPSPVQVAASADRSLHLITLSAKSDQAVRALARRYGDHLAAQPHERLPDVGFTANTGRALFAFRASVVAGSPAEASAPLEALATGRAAVSAIDGSDDEGPSVAFLFTGQGSQYENMGKRLYETHPGFREDLKRCDEILRPRLERSLLAVLFPSGGGGRLLDETLYTQPALFALEYALARLWQSWGVRPRAVMGHSLGEYVAACLAGVFSLVDALTLVAERASRMQTIAPPGAMVAVFADERRVHEAIEVLEGRIAIAAVNGPNHVVISGATDALGDVTARLNAAGIETTDLRVSHAFHSPVIEPMLDDFLRVASRIHYSASSLVLISNKTGRVATSEVETPRYWAEHARRPVQFASGMRTLYDRGCRVFLEIGPSATLLGMGARCLPGPASFLASLRERRDDWRQVLESLGRLHELGVRIDWEAFDRCYPRRRVSLPTYPFERRRYWFEGGAGRGVRNYRLSWHHQSRTGHRPENDRQGRGRWLVFADRGGLGMQLGRLLEERGESCQFVNAGEQFVRNSREHWTINPADDADFSRLLSETRGEAHLRGVVYLWTCDSDPHDELAPERLERELVVGCGGVVHLVRALTASEATGARLWIATRHALCAGPADAACPRLAQAPVWGIGKVIALEHPEIWGGLIDLDDHPDGSDATELLAELLETGEEDHVVFRQGRRLVGRLEVVEEKDAAPNALRLDGTFLITGGLGTLGLRVAGWLVAQGARHLVLVGRRRPSPAALVDLEELQRAGASVLIAEADVADEAGIRRILAQAAATMPPLCGVVHAAGVVTQRAIRDLEPNELLAVLRPKVLGGWILHRLTSQLDVKLFVCFSSVASVWGSKGQAHYSAANHFLDVLAQYRRRCGLSALSINWGPWSGGGMASPAALEWLERSGLRPIPPADGLAALGRLLTAEDAQRVVADVDWLRFRELFESRRRRPLLDLVTPRAARERMASRLAQPPESLCQLARLDPTELLDWLACHVRDAVALVLAITDVDALDPQQGFFRMGMDSLMAIELKNRLSAGLGLPLPSTVVFDYPNIRDLAGHLATCVSGTGKRLLRPAESSPGPSQFDSGGPKPEVASESDLGACVASRLSKLELLIREE